ncbi:phytanoyl-CoA dioxygenase [Chrysosporum ovalisporum FSS-45]|uniref:phytanoyl-CoA dioxygenase n=1 Tax=Umezakia ovalisporum TaxID=75695 RepID=UPI0024762166|nr:phytanoyl-CoA dioxygenase [Umezakia ovalisporum]MDH6078463.1 phytanoyl-CoA dioxygenase [Umezakia ovalisporum FSS-45]
MLNKIKKKVLTFQSECSYQTSLLKHSKKLPQLSVGDGLIVDILKKEGVYITTLTDLGLPHTEKLLQAAQRLLGEMKQVNDFHSHQKLPQIYTVTHLPDFYTWGTNKRLLNIIENYIGLPIIFHGVHLRNDFCNQYHFGTMLWHKDSEDRRIIKVIIYLRDVEEKHGPFEYLPLSLTSLANFNSYHVNRKLRESSYLGINDEQLTKIVPKSAWKSCIGSAGTVIIADTRAILHHGTIRTEDRSTLFFVYTANPPKRPELCRQYWDNTFTIPGLNSASSDS